MSSPTCMLVYVLSRFSRVHLFVTPWTVARQAPLSMGLSRQEYWSGLSFPSPEDLSNPGIEPRSPALQADSLPAEPQGKPLCFKGKWFLCNVLSKYILKLWYSINHGLLWWLSGKETTWQSRRCEFDLWVGKIPWRRAWLPTPVFLPGEFHGQRSLTANSTWGSKELDMTERLSTAHNAKNFNNLKK